jgi:hypothetical protein
MTDDRRRSRVVAGGPSRRPHPEIPCGERRRPTAAGWSIGAGRMVARGPGTTAPHVQRRDLRPLPVSAGEFQGWPHPDLRRRAARRKESAPNTRWSSGLRDRWPARRWSCRRSRLLVRRADHRRNAGMVTLEPTQAGSVRRGQHEPARDPAARSRRANGRVEPAIDCCGRDIDQFERPSEGVHPGQSARPERGRAGPLR